MFHNKIIMTDKTIRHNQAGNHLVTKLLKSNNIFDRQYGTQYS